MNKLIITILFVLTAGTAVVAQQTNDLSGEEIEAFKVQCQERVDALQMALEIIADKCQNSEIKQHYIRTIPEMFMGNGDAWTDNSGGVHAAVKMQVSSASNGRITDIPLKQYLTRLRDMPYTSVELKKAKTCMISNLYKVSDNLYMGTCTFFQYFTGQTGESVVYRDYTQKEVDVYISRIADGSIGTYWDMKFGDINVTETRKM